MGIHHSTDSRAKSIPSYSNLNFCYREGFLKTFLFQFICMLKHNRRGSRLSTRNRHSSITSWHSPRTGRGGPNANSVTSVVMLMEWKLSPVIPFWHLSMGFPSAWLVPTKEKGRHSPLHSGGAHFKQWALNSPFLSVAANVELTLQPKRLGSGLLRCHHHRFPGSRCSALLLQVPTENCCQCLF